MTRIHAIRATSPDDVLSHIGDGADIVIPLANGEPVALMDAIEAHADRLHGVRVHQMHALHDRPYLHGTCGDQLRYVAYFLSPITRVAFQEGGCELVPCHFSEVPQILRESTRDPLVLAATSPMDRHGYFSLGTNADYTSSFIGHARFFLEVNPNMPRTFGRNQVHVSQAIGYYEADYPLVEVPPPKVTDTDVRIAEFVAERIPDGATLQAGIGAIPNAIMSLLDDHHDLGIHTELLSDGIITLVERGVVTGVKKRLNTNKIIATFCLGTKVLYDFLHENPAVELWPVDYVNDPRVIAREPNFVSINATLEVDLLGQCASETIEGRYYSGSGGQADFARGAMFARQGQGFLVLHATTADESRSRIRAQFAPGTVVTTLKNTVDKIVTEYGVAELKGRAISQRARELVRVAHPKFRDELTYEARQLGYL
ncbi:MAG: acetyl-CoA hydrolase/transferase family protein [Acidimicrobiales bacterium]|nr:acetyl-CoA hydrolase/transferase family protein [Acidimicrobiales bacterium]